MKVFTTIFLLTFSILFLNAADSYEKGDTLYVWANSGLNLRTSPLIDSKLIETLKPGTQLTVIGISNNEFVYELYASSGFEKHPYLLYGNWVKVSTEKGNEGFVFDSFLLDIPLEPNLDYKSYLESITYKVDTLNANNQCAQPDLKGFCEYDITYEYSCNEKGGRGQISLPDFTLEEAVIFWEYFMNYEEGTKDNKHIKLMKNWKNVIILNNYVWTEIKYRANITEIKFIWSC